MKKFLTTTRIIPVILVIAVLIFSMSTTPEYSNALAKPRPTRTPTPTPTAIPDNPCATSSPSSGAYSITLCFTAPSTDSTISGPTQFDVSVSTAGTFPGITRMVFSINGGKLLIDYQSPYSFLLPSMKWQDGSYNITVVAVMRDGYTSANPGSITLGFSNGNPQPPVNSETFTPATGTTPPDGAPFIVAATGDGADGATNATNVTNRIAAINPNLFLYLGDVYQDGTFAEFYNWYGTGSTSYSRFNAITNPTIGNHEYIGSSAAGYFDYWNNIPDYYSYHAGGWHFVSLNSNTSRIGVDMNSAQYAWLAQDLETNSSLCTIVYYHHPLFNIGPEGATTAMSDIWALMAQSGVSIVLNGHDHDYQRWVPLDGNGQPSVNGVTEFVAGGGGHSLQTITNSDPRVAFADYLNPQAFGVLKLALNPSGANFEYINYNGSSLDSGVIPCAKTGIDTQAPSIPNGLSGSVVTATQVDLYWQPSTDNVGVAGYTIYRDNAVLATVAGSTLSYSDMTTSPATTYSYTVDAYDAAGNHSAQSSPASATTPALPSSLTFDVQADTYVNSSLPTTNYGSATVWRADGSPDVHAYLRFSVQGLGGSPVAHAYLHVFANTSSSAGINALTVADNTWGENTVTHNTAPALGTSLGSSGAYAAGSWITLDVTPFITSEGTYSFGITTLGSTSLSFAAKESGVNAAYLVVALP